MAISPRVATVFRHHAITQGPIPPDGLVFCKPDGQPLRPQRVLDRLRRLSAEAGVPKVTVHDLRHLAATLPITAGVPLITVSKTLRHSTLSTTANIYHHLTRKAASDAVDTIAAVLGQADRAAAHHRWPTWLRPHRDHSESVNGTRQASSSARLPLLESWSRTVQGMKAAHATTMRPSADETSKRAAPTSLRKRPTTCGYASRDDRI
ncbi:tyrosine-type recombinase/integrase [Kitasatospora sp. KL5]|uniref:tyrosine-type recombinase/integrase n=1 Tax=Kitasatospora sp. KL5 TaxID=3425125 RepID=UPI003D6EC38D